MQGFIHEVDTISNHGSDALSKALEPFELTFHIYFQGGEHGLVLVGQVLESGRKLVKIREKVTDAEACPGSFGGVSWSDSLLGGADILPLLCLTLYFLQPVHCLVEVEHKVSPVRDDETLLPVLQPFLLVLLCLFKQARQVDDHAIANE